MNKLFIAVGIIAVCIVARFVIDSMDHKENTQQEVYQIENMKFNGPSLFPSSVQINTEVLNNGIAILKNSRQITCESIPEKNLYKIRSASQDKAMSIFDEVNYALQIDERGTAIKNMDQVFDQIGINAKSLAFENYGKIEQSTIDALDLVPLHSMVGIDVMTLDPFLTPIGGFYNQAFDFNQMDKKQSTSSVDSTRTIVSEYAWLDNTDSTAVKLVCTKTINIKLYKSDSVWYDLQQNRCTKIISSVPINDSISVVRNILYAEE